MAEHEWEQLQAERPTSGYATLLHRMAVPGGYIYKDTTMYLRGMFGPKFTTSLASFPFRHNLRVNGQRIIVLRWRKVLKMRSDRRRNLGATRGEIAQ
jgi:hypothetical protein